MFTLVIAVVISTGMVLSRAENAIEIQSGCSKYLIVVYANTLSLRSKDDHTCRREMLSEDYLLNYILIKPLDE
jgi:hypothetical protein